MAVNPLIHTINRIRKSGRIALCGYFLTGYRTPEMFYQAVKSASGLDIIEFGIPSSNPYLDGATIGEAHRTVVEDRGVLTETSLALIGGLRNLVQPRFVMTYAKDGRELKGFFRLCVENHIHGVLAPDISLEESIEIAQYAKTLDLAYISFIHLEMTITEMLARAALSQIVYVKISTGATGAYAHMGDCCKQFTDTVQLLRAHFPSLIVAAGIGIQEPSQIARCAELGADMVIVGTILVSKMDHSLDAMNECIESFSLATEPSFSERPLYT